MAEVIEEDVDFFLKIPFFPFPTSPSSAMVGGESRYVSSSTVTRL